MKGIYFKIENIPAVLYGDKSDKVYLFVHGKCGYKEEALAFAQTACNKGYQVVAVDLPEHGERKSEVGRFNPWNVVPELVKVMNYIKTKWDHILLRANSIGAMFLMESFRNEKFEKCLFVSPLLDMQKLISNMMIWAQVTEDELKKAGEIQTSFGETLSWKYLTYVRANPIIKWDSPTAILYAGKDNMTDRKTVDEFVNKYKCELDVMDSGEHWFHTPEQLNVLRNWEKENIGRS